MNSEKDVEECRFAVGSFQSKCRFMRKDYCINPKAKIHALRRHISKAQTVLAKLEKVWISKE